MSIFLFYFQYKYIKMKLEDIVNNKCKELTSIVDAVLGLNDDKLKIDYTIMINNNKFTDNTIDVIRNEKKIMRINYQILGIFDSQTKLFTWGCDFEIVNRNLTSLSKLIKKKSKTMKNIISNMKYSDVDYLEEIYYYLSNNIFYIDDKYLKKLINISLFITKKKGIVVGNGNLFNNEQIPTQVFYIITDIIGT